MILAFLQGQGTQIVTDAEREAEQVRRVLPVLQALPAGDLILGGVMLVVIVLIHGACMRLVTGHVLRRAKVVSLHPTEWGADMLLAGAILLLLTVHLFETGLWTTVLVRSHLVPQLARGRVLRRQHLHHARLWIGDSRRRAGRCSRRSSPSRDFSPLAGPAACCVDIVGRVNRLKDLAENRSPPAAPTSP